MGGNITGLKLGVVNHEIKSIEECKNQSLITAEVKNFKCSLQKVSCNFFMEFEAAELVKFFKVLTLVEAI